jgi:hypothetical protein
MAGYHSGFVQDFCVLRCLKDSTERGTFNLHPLMIQGHEIW